MTNNYRTTSLLVFLKYLRMLCIISSATIYKLIIYWSLNNLTS